MSEDTAPTPKSNRGVVRRVFGSGLLAWSVAVVATAVAVAAILIDAHLEGRTSRLQAEARVRAEVLSHQVRTSQQLLDVDRRLRASSAVLEATNSRLRVQNGELRANIQNAATLLRNTRTTLTKVRKTRVRTVVKTVTVTKRVPVWVPSGPGIQVETTGYKGEISVNDVQLTTGLGYSNLVGIAQNLTDRTIPYAEIGCTFVDRDGAVIANNFANTNAWPAGATWGFTCSAPVDGATGGVVRVDQLVAGSTSPAVAGTATAFPRSNPGCRISRLSDVRLLDVQIATHALNAGFRGAHLAKAVAVGLAESAGDPNALCVNANGTRDVGLWQINNVHGVPSKCAFDPQCNASEAYVLYRAAGGTFDDWASFGTGSYLGFIERGEAAVRTLGQRVAASPFVCPVDEPRSFGDSFGAPTNTEGSLLHAGTDVVAPMGTPIRAPFDGTAVASPTPSGGLAVKVYGVAGWVSNAHLSAYGTLGPVGAGTIIGYVGNTGDTEGRGTYDHLEWHPKVIPPHPWTSLYGATLINGAIDPYPLLKSACG
jgi:hypothetical protein